MADITVENVVVSCKLASSLDVKAAVEKLAETQLIRDADACVLHVEEPKAAVVLSSDGRAVLTGSRDLDDAELALKMACKTLSSAGILAKWTSDVTVEYVVASSHLGGPVGLKQLSERLLVDGGLSGVSGSVVWNKRKFPGLMFKVSEGETVLMVFSSGRMVCTGKDAGRIAILLGKMEEVVGSLKSNNV